MRFGPNNVKKYKHIYSETAGDLVKPAAPNPFVPWTGKASINLEPRREDAQPLRDMSFKTLGGVA